MREETEQQKKKGKGGGKKKYNIIQDEARRDAELLARKTPLEEQLPMKMKAVAVDVSGDLVVIVAAPRSVVGIESQSATAQIGGVVRADPLWMASRVQWRLN